jgi:hypothetical protein
MPASHRSFIFLRYAYGFFYGPCRGSFLSLWGSSADSSQKVRHVVAGEATSYNNIAPNLFFYKAPDTFRLTLLTRRRLRASRESSHLLAVPPSTSIQISCHLPSWLDRKTKANPISARDPPTREVTWTDKKEKSHSFHVVRL